MPAFVIIGPMELIILAIMGLVCLAVPLVVVVLVIMLSRGRGEAE